MGISVKGQKVQNLLFDLGNVIIDLDIDKTFNELKSLFRSDADKSIVDRIMIEYECGRVSTEIFINTLLSQSKRSVQALNIIEVWNAMLIGIPSYRLEMLRILKENFNVYLLSNTNELHLEWVHRYLIRVHNINDFENQFFDHAYYSHHLGDRKPFPSIYKHIIDDSFMTPSFTLYMDDVQENIDVAKKLGFKTYLVKPQVDIAEYLKREGFY
ncbi:MAG: HAD family phosphatase [Saprospiraceae bacterium]